jgi:arylsulfatase A-like enzyme
MAPRFPRLLLATLLTALCACSDDGPQRNVLIISVDTLRADRLGLYGNDDWGSSPSPGADALAAEGVTFDMALAPRGQTHPSMASMLTGKYPITTGLRENGLALHSQHVTLFEHLLADGFQTGIFLANLDSRPGSEDWAYRGAELVADGFAGRRHLEAPREAHFQSTWDQRVEDATLDFLGQLDDDRPFAAWVHFYDVHKPYTPEGEYLTRYGLVDGLPDELVNPIKEDGKPLARLLRDVTFGNRELSAAELQRILGLYDGGVAATDARLERVLAALEQTGRAEDTYIVFTSDHGEELYDRNRYFFHGNSLYQGVLRLPLVFTGPDLPAGSRIPAHVQNVDIAPTVMDLLGVPADDAMEGKSLVALMRDETNDPPRPVSFIEWQDVLYAATDGVHKYVHNPQHAHLLKSPFTRKQDGTLPPFGYRVDCFEGYNLSDDVREANNLLADIDPTALGSGAGLPPEFAALRTALERWLAEPHHEREMSWPGLTAARVEAMEQLGYVSGGIDRPDVMLMEPCVER